MLWPMYHQVERRARRLQDLMDGLGVNAAALARHQAGDAFYVARTSCIGCVKGDTCARWLALSPENRERPTFCPNIDLLETFALPRQIDR
jgi:hypothetical protein